MNRWVASFSTEATKYGVSGSAGGVCGLLHKINLMVLHQIVSATLSCIDSGAI